MEQQGPLLGIVEVGCMTVGERDQFVEMLDIVIAAMRLVVMLACRRDEPAVAQPAHQLSSVLRILSNTSWNIAVVSRPVFVL
jgi:hypothetical protein